METAECSATMFPFLGIENALPLITAKEGALLVAARAWMTFVLLPITTFSDPMEILQHIMKYLNS